MTRRSERIAEQLRADIARVLQQEVADPRIGLVTITRLDVAPDLSNAIVYWSALAASDVSAPDIDAIDEGLASAASYVRRALAKNSPLKRTPALHFRYDPSLAQGSETLETLRKLGRPRDGA